MKKIFVMTMLAALAAGCASSYEDRLDALNRPEDGPPQDVSAPADDGRISRDEIPLSGACIVSADCASYQHCELGRCVALCGAETPCEDGLFCSSRGRCVSDANYVDMDPALKATAPVGWSVDQRVVRLNAGQNGASFNISVDAGGSLQYRVQVEPEGARDAVSVSDSEGVIASGGTKQLTVSVNRDSLGAGDHRVAVNVISDGGQRMVIYEFSNGLNGRYAGFVDYTQPGLGRVPFIVDLKEDAAGNVAGRVVSTGSLLFPVERTMTGRADHSRNTLFLSTADIMEAGTGHDPFERDIGREIYVFGDVSEQRVIKGDVEEIVSGLLPRPMTVIGEIYLERINEDVDPIVARPSPTMPAFPAAPTSYTACTGFTAACDTEAEFRSNMTGCSTELRSSAFRLGVGFTGTDSSGRDIVDFGLVEECESEVSGASSGDSCVDIADLACLRADQQHHLMNTAAQDAEFGQYFDDLKNVQRLYAFMGNDLLVEAYRTTVEEVSNPLSLELSRLESALEEYEKAERAFFGAPNISVTDRAGRASVSAQEYDLFRVPLQYLGASQSALKSIVALTLRKDLSRTDRREELRRRVQQHGRVIFFEGLALAHLIVSHGGSFENELAQIADELRSVSLTAGVIGSEANPLGYPDDYVPFIYDPSDASSANNFLQLAAMAGRTAAGAVEKAELADGTTEIMQIRTEDIRRRIEEIGLSFESEIRQICGVASLDLLGDCGKGGGELALVYNDIEQQYFEIEKINQQIMNLNEMVKIKRDTAIQIMSVKNKTLNFLQTTGAQLEALDLASAEVTYAMLKSQGLFGSIGGFFSAIGGVASGFGSIAGGIGAAFDTDIIGSIGGIAGGIGRISESIGSASSARSADAALRQGRIDERRTNIRNMQQMRFQEEGMEIFAIQAAEEVKLLLLQMAQLNLDLELADVRLAQQTIRATNLIDRVDFLKHQRDVLLTQATQSVTNPLSNLSFRLKRDHAVILASNEFDKALADVYLAARGLEHELNVEIPQIESQLFQANGASQLQDYLDCLRDWYDDYRIAFGSPHQEVTQISLREDVLGFKELVTDEVTGEVIQPQEIFRRVVFDPKHITQSGSVEFPFVTSISGSDKQFSTLVCNDRIKEVRVKLVGDFLGDNEATVMLRQEGNSYVRDCSADPAGGNDVLNTYHLDERGALVQAGVNSFGLAAANRELSGRSVASDRWVIVIPTGDGAPNNGDMDILNIDDIVIEITHEARTLNRRASSSVFGQCNI